MTDCAVAGSCLERAYEVNRAPGSKRGRIGARLHLELSAALSLVRRPSVCLHLQGRDDLIDSYALRPPVSIAYYPGPWFSTSRQDLTCSQRWRLASSTTVGTDEAASSTIYPRARSASCASEWSFIDVPSRRLSSGAQRSVTARSRRAASKGHRGPRAGLRDSSTRLSDWCC